MLQSSMLIERMLGDIFPNKTAFLHDVISYHANRTPDKPAVLYEEQELSWRQFSERVKSLANALTKLAEPGARVAIISDNRPEILECLYGIPAAGLIAAPVNNRFTAGEIKVALAKLEPEILIIEAKSRALVRNVSSELGIKHLIVLGKSNGKELAYETMLKRSDADGWPKIRRSSRDTAWILFTSGTSGQPRGAMLSHASLLLSFKQASAETLPGYLDRMLFCLPHFHVAVVSAFVAHYAGGAVVLMKRYTAEDFLRHIEKYRVTITMIVPVMGVAILKELQRKRYDLRSLKLISYLGDKMPPELLRYLLKRFGRVIRPGGQYGMTELGGTVIRLDRRNYFKFHFYWRVWRRKVRPLMTVTGVPYQDVQVRVVDDQLQDRKQGEPGELLVRTGQVMQGYWRDEAATKEVLFDGWLRTGDIAVQDKRGFYHIMDRKKDVIITGGENVYPSEIERVLIRHPGVWDAAVIGLPDEQWGQAVTAVVVPRRGRVVSEDELIKFVRSRLAGYKTPKKIYFIEALPRTATGKVQKQQLVEEFVKSKFTK